jgi:hypothetical protein
MARDELARVIADEALFTRPSDGQPAPSDQLRLRARRYSHLFECSDPACTRIRLTETARAGAASARPKSKTSAASKPRPRGSRPAPAGPAQARARRTRAQNKYKPETIELLLIAEAPPAALDRYFYFENVTAHDSLFRYIARGVLGVEPTRGGKAEVLAALRDRGVFLIDLKPDPVDGTPLADQVPTLVDRVCELDPEKVILIKATVYDAAFRALRDAGLPVVDERVPFPGSGQQRRFKEAFARALKVSS